MKFEDIILRTETPEPWDEGDKIPWDNPEFSRRMLHEHLSQAHDLASRRASLIDQHVAWIHQSILNSTPGRVLDLGCGPGLYTSRFAALGHECVGIDFSPASIDYAQTHCEQSSGHRCSYRRGDIRSTDYGTGYDLVMLIFGEFNMFSPEDARTILRKACHALLPTGQLLLEVHTHESMETMGRSGTSWRSSSGGLFSDRPHLVLNESFWHDQRLAATRRMFVVDVETFAVDRYVETAQAYTLDGYTSMLVETGFALRRTYPALPGSPESSEFLVLVADPG